jgi:hypothetical protein
MSTRAIVALLLLGMTTLAYPALARGGSHGSTTNSFLNHSHRFDNNETRLSDTNHRFHSRNSLGCRECGHSLITNTAPFGTSFLMSGAGIPPLVETGEQINVESYLRERGDAHRIPINRSHSSGWERGIRR